MNNAVKTMLSTYDLSDLNSYRNALKEVIQEIALFGLWRAKFFEHAAFYGGTALRILYGLDRFSEDLDFSLLKPQKIFSLSAYHEAVQKELEAFGFQTQIIEKKKGSDSPVQSAFIKANTLEHLLMIEISGLRKMGLGKGELLKIRFEVDTDPPLHGNTEAKTLLLPSPFSIKTFSIEELFAGKMHAVLCRQWKGRVKGRDWYDMVWFLAKQVELDLKHLESRMKQTGHMESKETLSPALFLKIYKERIEKLDVDSAKTDILQFIDDPIRIEIWSMEFFSQLSERFHFC
ncbi:MAG: putative nucleotidyltransferase component of viral defense system [Chlamydiales bacterium]|jgi:predicted nucleotidyltransferase component of viral defense system